MAGWVLRLSAMALLLGLPPVLQPGRAHACVCGEPPTVVEALERADAVFAGRVVSVSEGPVVEFRVSRVWKGEPLETIFLDYSSDADRVVALPCGDHFREGGEHLVYAGVTDDGELRAGGACGRVSAPGYPQEDLLALGEGRVPEPGTSAPRPGEPDSPSPPAAGTGSAAEARTSVPWAIQLLAGVGVVAGLISLAARRGRAPVRPGHPLRGL